MARDTHNTRFYTLSSFCESAISLKGLGKLGLLINEAPRQASDLLDPAVPLSRALVSSLQSGDCAGKRKGSQFRPELPQIFKKNLLEAAVSLALKVSARTVVGKAGRSLCQKVRAEAEETHSLEVEGGGGEGEGGSVLSHSGPPSLLPIPEIGDGY